MPLCAASDYLGLVVEKAFRNETGEPTRLPSGTAPVVGSTGEQGTLVPWLGSPYQAPFDPPWIPAFARVTEVGNGRVPARFSRSLKPGTWTQ